MVAVSGAGCAARQFFNFSGSFWCTNLEQWGNVPSLQELVQAGLAMSDHCLFQKNKPFSEVKFKVSNM